jgi:hypothetical protein
MHKIGNICWWVGPYLPSIWNDDMMFKHELAKMLEPAERVEADGSYQGSMPELVKCPGVVEVDLDNVEMQQRVRSHQAMVNEWFKNWAILSTPYRHQLLEHQTVFGAIVVLT